MKEISSAENEKWKAFARLCKEKRAREEAGVCVLDGAKICADALAKGHEIRELWLSEEVSAGYEEQLRALTAAAKELYVLKGKAAARISELKAPQGVFAVIGRPAPSAVQDLCSCRRVLALCEIQNPENAAAAVRTAAALGYEGVLLSADCADIWSPRCIRAGAGAQLDLRICVADRMEDALETLKEAGFRTLAAALTESAVPLDRLKPEGKAAVVIGNEGHGLPEQVIAACTDTVIIPMSGAVESLNANAAASILMWELREK